MSSAFPPAIAAALDRYDVPALSDGFADRLVARAVAESAATPGAPARRSAGAPWRRTSRLIGSVGILGLFSATAAAMGFFGKPVEIPVISEVARELNLVAQPTFAASATATSRSELTVEPGETGAAPDTSGNPVPTVAKQRLEELTGDPRFENLTPRQKRLVVRSQSRKLVRSGAASPVEVRSAIRDIRRERLGTDPARAAADGRLPDRLADRVVNVTPEQKAKLRARFEALPVEQQEAIRQRLEGKRNLDSGTDQAGDSPVVSLAPAASDGQNPVVTPEAGDPQSSVPPATNVDSQLTIDQLRDRYQQATPAQQAIIREKMLLYRQQVKRRAQRRDRPAPVRPPRP